MAFSAVKVITERLFPDKEGYSKFCIVAMANYVETSHVLVIQSDGWILNPGAWNDQWLQYDYIGAPWPYATQDVGNGGFSLRSKKLLDTLKRVHHLFPRYHPEDVVICRDQRAWLERNYAVRFAPRSVAERFSIEAYGAKNLRYNGQFGYHGAGIDFSHLPEAERPY